MDRKLISVDLEKCVACSSCIRSCPVYGANYSMVNRDGKRVVNVDEDKCIRCGRCISACDRHARSFGDDTEQFWSALQGRRDITVIVAPAVRTAFGADWEALLWWLREKGVERIYDVGLGADICTWAHLQYLKKKPGKLITQPCAAITDYIVKYKPELIRHLSPIFSPMMCTAVYLRKYRGVTGEIYALSPCIAKKEEFIRHGMIEHNVTFSELRRKLEENHINLSASRSQDGRKTPFSEQEGGYGVLYPMPGGLKENLLLHQPGLRILNAEGVPGVYHKLNQYQKAEERQRPDIFDVLSCEYGCSSGPGVGSEPGLFETSAPMLQIKGNLQIRKAKQRYRKFDRQLKLEDFITSYQSSYVPEPNVSNAQMEKEYGRMGKFTQMQKNFNCGACGFATCEEMAKAVSLGYMDISGCMESEKYRAQCQQEKAEKLSQDLQELSIEIRQVFERLYEEIALVSKDSKNINELNKACEADMGRITESVSVLEKQSKEILEAMGEIKVSVKSYGAMTDTVQHVARETSLLSLNASVEAARAGEAGKGFAVVSEEVRRLAMETQSTVSTAEANQNSIHQAAERVDIIISSISQLAAELLRASSEAVQSVEATTSDSTSISVSMSRISEAASQVNNLLQTATTVSE